MQHVRKTDKTTVINVISQEVTSLKMTGSRFNKCCSKQQNRLNIIHTFGLCGFQINTEQFLPSGRKKHADVKLERFPGSAIPFIDT